MDSKTEVAPQARKPPKYLQVIGIAASGAWLLALLIYALVNCSKIGDLDPNEVGDFLAGVFAPLAFLWLVLGFFQQGEELRHSSEALWLQGRELQNSVEQQRELVNVTREQLRFESEVLAQQREELARSSSPMLEITASGSAPHEEGKRSYAIYVQNHGRPCTKLVILRDGDRLSVSDSLQTGARRGFRIAFQPNEVVSFSITVTYVDERLLAGTKTWNVSFERGHFTFSDAGAAVV